MALHLPVAFDVTIALEKLCHEFCWVFSHTLTRFFFVCANNVLVHRKDGILYFNILRNDGARRSTWDMENHTVVSSLVDKLGIVGGSPFSMCF